MALYPAAEKRLLAPGLNHSSGGMGAIHGVVVHVVVGSLAAADGAFHKPGFGASAHFGVDEVGHVMQWVDTHDKAWAEAAGNPNWISIETAGKPETPLTDAQLQAVAALVRWVHDTHPGWPLQVTDSPDGQGVGTHVMGGAAWGGHSCPGPIRAAQRSDIVRLAVGVPAPAPTVPEEDTMLVHFTHPTNANEHYVGSVETWFKHLVTPAQAKDYKTLRLCRDEVPFPMPTHIFIEMREVTNLGLPH